VVEVVEVVIAKLKVVEVFISKASKSSLMSTRQKASPSRVADPLVCSPSPSWSVLMSESKLTLGAVDVVIVVEVDVRTEVANEPLESKCLTKVW
jgi:hypothetical protein